MSHRGAAVSLTLPLERAILMGDVAEDRGDRLGVQRRAVGRDLFEGQPIGTADPMIAAIALRHGLDLVSGNAGLFQRIQDLGFPLTLLDWR